MQGGPRHSHPPLRQSTPRLADFPATGDLALLFQRDGRFPAGSVVPDITELEPGDILLFDTGGAFTNPVSFYQRVCGYAPDASGYTHAGLFLADDRMVHAVPEFSPIGATGVRVVSLLEYWTTQHLTVLRVPTLNESQRLRVALLGAAMHGLRYGYQDVTYAIRHLLQIRPGTTQRDVEDLVNERRTGQPVEALPTTSSCARLVVSAYNRVEPTSVRGRRLSPIVLPAYLAGLMALQDVRMSYAEL